MIKPDTHTLKTRRMIVEVSDWVATYTEVALNSMEHHELTEILARYGEEFRPQKAAGDSEPVEYTASGIEVQPLDWDRAKKHLDFYEKEYRELGSAGAFGLGVTIMPLQDRYARGERTKWLYDDIMEVE